MSGSQRGGGRGRGFPPSGPIAQRGGRGRGGGYFSQDQGESGQTSTKPIPFVYGNGNFPAPSEHVNSVEKQYIEYCGTKGQKLDEDLGGKTLPHRPNFGSNGREVVLWANYFHLKFKQSERLYQYDVAIYDPKKIPDEKDNGKATDLKEIPGDKKNDGKVTDPKNISEDSKDDGRVTGRRAMDIFRQIFDQVRTDNTSGVLATDFKQKIVTLGFLNPPRKELNYNSRRYIITVSEPQLLEVDRFMSLLDNRQFASPATMNNLNVFPFHQDTISAINTIMGHAPRESGDIAAVGSSRFFIKEKPDLTQGIIGAGALQIIKGFIQSVRPATGRLLLNVNVTHGIFRPKVEIPELFQKINEGKGKFSDKLQTLHEIVRKARLRYQIPSAKKGEEPRWKEVTAAGLARSTDTSSKHKGKVTFVSGGPFGYAHKVKFYLGQPPKRSDGTTVNPAPGLQWGKDYTVSDYYRIKYGHRANSDLPLVNVGLPTDPVYVPAELCELVGFDPIKYKLDEQTSSKMIEFSVKTPPENADWIVGEGLKDVLKHSPSNSLLEKFGLTVEPELITVRGRQLEPPQVTYKSIKDGKQTDLQVSVERAGWTMKDRRGQGIGFFGKGQPIVRWAYITFSPETDDLQSIQSRMAGFKNYISGLRVSIPTELDSPEAKDPAFVNIPYQKGDSMEVVTERLETELRKLERPYFALVILPDNGADIYMAVKIVGDINLGFHTICVTKDKFLNEKFEGPNGDANLAAKINLKLGGTNHAILPVYTHCEARNTMFVGYDVVHPTGQAGNEEDMKSQVGLVSNINPHCGQWRGSYWTQPGRQEILDDKLTEKFESLLKVYHKYQYSKEVKLPKTIIIYRDGVSEGQYLQVLEKELPLIRTACERVYERVYGKEAAQPRITMLVSVKRHATRFFPTRQQEMDFSTYLDPSHKNYTSRNIKSGTVVDRGVTQARYWDFYLTAHSALKGTARPAHYVVLHDEDFGHRHLEKLPGNASPRDVLEAGRKSVDELEAITHHLCYVFGRATKAISICTPARYADIVCTRARLHASGLARLAARPGLSQEARDAILARTVHERLQDSMYWI